MYSASIDTMILAAIVFSTCQLKVILGEYVFMRRRLDQLSELVSGEVATLVR